LTPNSLAIVEASFRQEDQTRAIGAWSALSGLGSALGPIVGGYLVDVTSWRAVFLLNLPLGAGIVLVAARHVPESRDRTATARLDLKGAALVTVGLAGATAALTEMARPGRTPALIAIVAAVGFAGLLMFLVHERRTRDPMVPLELFDSRQFVSANVVTFAVYAALGGVFFLLVIHLQVVLGYSALAAGAASVPVTVIMLLSPYSGVLADRIGPRWQLTAGPLLLATAIAMMARIGPGDTYPRSVLPAVLVFGIGLTLTVAPITATALAAVDSAHAGIASGVNTAVSRIAGLAAVAALPPAAGLSGSDFQDPEALKHGFPVAMIVIAAVAAAGGLLAAATISNDVLRTRAESTQ
jgi:MFS family permease